MNILRVWGGGVYETEYFYDTADKLGILIWQDFMFACSMYPTNLEYLENVRTEVEYQLYRLRHHPSIIAWSGNNENEAALADNWYNTDTKRELYEKDYRELYIKTIREKVLEIEPVESRPFISSSPSNGVESEEENWVAKNPYDALYGDVHFYDYKADGWDPASYPITRFMSEFGFQSLPSLSTITTAYDFDDLGLFSQLNQHRQHHEDGNQEILFEIMTHFSVPTIDDFISIIYLSQINQAMSLKTGVEVCRRNRDTIEYKSSKGLCWGIMYWQLNDVWVAPTWSSVDFGGVWKLAHYFIKLSFANLLISPFIDRLSGRLEVHLLSDFLVMPIKNSVVMSVYGYDGGLEAKYVETIDFTIGSMSSLLVKKIDLVGIEKKTGCRIDDEYFKCLFIFSFKENLVNVSYGENFLFSINKFRNIEFEMVNVTGIVKFSQYQFIITLKTDKIRLFVRLEIQNPNIIGYFSNNGFHMVESTYQLFFMTSTDNLTQDDVRKYLVVTSILLK
jgi:beta-mannosidase